MASFHTGIYPRILHPVFMTLSGPGAPSISPVSFSAQEICFQISLGHGQFCKTSKAPSGGPTMHPFLLWGLVNFLGLYWRCKEHVLSILTPHNQGLCHLPRVSLQSSAQDQATSPLLVFSHEFSSSPSASTPHLPSGIGNFFYLNYLPNILFTLLVSYFPPPASLPLSPKGSFWNRKPGRHSYFSASCYHIPPLIKEAQTTLAAAWMRRRKEEDKCGGKESLISFCHIHKSI